MSGTQGVTGDRDLTPSEIGFINAIKEDEAMIATRLRAARELNGDREDTPLRSEAYRQLAIARTEFEGAFMRLVRAIAAPVTPWER